MSIQIYDYQQLDLMNQNTHTIKFINQPKNPNRLYLSWKNYSGLQCKMIGPQTKCFCNHRFKQHQHLNPINGKTTCTTKGCKCKAFQYIPTHGSYDFKCLCKHSFKQHDRNSKKCQKQKCTNCNTFNSAWTCSCGQRYDKHITVSQTLQQRKKQGKLINDMNRLNSQLQNNVKQGSLYRPLKQDNRGYKQDYRPIKQDRQSKLKRYSQVIGRDSIVTQKTLKQIQNQNQDQIQEIDLKRNYYQKKF